MGTAALPPGETGPAGVLDGLASLAGRYDGFLIDQWGVLHDGKTPYAGAQACLQHLMARGSTVLIVSNSGKRARLNAERMTRLGFPPASYTSLITSGEVAWQALAEPRAPAYWHLGHRCLVIAGEGDGSLLEGLPITVVPEPEQAEFVLLASIEDDARFSQYMTLLNRALVRGLPLVCTNPDRVRLTRHGTAPAVGALAHEYEKMGGSVRFIGKPHPEVYHYARQQFARHGVHRVLAIGDSLQHDIRGAQEAGFDTVFIRDGIFRARFAGLAPAAQQVLLEQLAEKYDARPDWVMPLLAW